MKPASMEREVRASYAIVIGHSFTTLISLPYVCYRSVTNALKYICNTLYIMEGNNYVRVEGEIF